MRQRLIGLAVSIDMHTCKIAGDLQTTVGLKIQAGCHGVTTMATSNSFSANSGPSQDR